VKNLACVLLLALGGGGAYGQAPTITHIALHAMAPQLTISSPLGATNQIQYAASLSGSNAWLVLTNLMVTASPYVFADAGPLQAARFYRVVALTNAPSPPAGMVLVPSGSFILGDSLDGEGDAPTNTVYVSAFCTDSNDVTETLWEQVYDWAITNGYNFDNPGSAKADSHPVQTLDWYDCVKWCNARSEMAGLTPAYYTDETQASVYRTGDLDLATNCVNWGAGFRLPTEAEWEKAARGGLSGQRFPWGDTISESQANYYSGAGYPYDLSDTGFNPDYNDGVSPYTSPAGAFAPNGYGLCDVAGNVWQWCWDWYGSYGAGPQSDPRGPDGGSCRVIRGGSWNDDAQDCRSAQRISYCQPTEAIHNIGFRTVLPQSQP
jgi:formylglycine-generating enzyme required for sulfatase activity